MRPTLGEELAGLRRVLQEVVSDPGLAADSAAAVKDASAILTRLEKSWHQVLPYVLADIAELTGLLVDISQHLPDEMHQDIQDLAVEQRRLVDATGVIPRANDLQETARTLVSRAIELLPPDPPGQEGPLARIRMGLASSLEARPW